MEKPSEFEPTSEYKLALCDIWLYEKRDEQPFVPEYLKARLRELIEVLISISEEPLPIEPNSLGADELIKSDLFIKKGKVYSYKSVTPYSLDNLLLMLDDGLFLVAVKLRQAKYWSEEQLRHYIYEYINIDDENSEGTAVFADNLINRYCEILPSNVLNFVSDAIEWRKQHGTQKQHDEICEYFDSVAEENKKEFEVKSVSEESHLSNKGRIKLPLIESELFGENIIDKQYNWKLSSEHKKGSPSIIPYLSYFIHKLDEYGYFNLKGKNSKMASFFSHRYNLTEKEEKSLTNALKVTKLEAIGKQVKLDIDLCLDRIGKKHLIV